MFRLKPGRVAALVGCLLVGSVSGCGGSPPTKSRVPTQKEILEEVWDMYKSHVAARKRPPNTIDDLNPYEPGAIYGYGSLNAGEIILFYGGKSAPGPQVLAYPKGAQQNGGPVLLADGTVKEMTAAEFAAAPKAGK